jgi:putative transposase
LLAGGMDNENIEIQLQLQKTKKIKIKHLTSLQIQFIKKWNYHSRYTYNKALSYLKEILEQPENNKYDYNYYNDLNIYNKESIYKELNRIEENVLENYLNAIINRNIKYSEIKSDLNLLKRMYIKKFFNLQTEITFDEFIETSNYEKDLINLFLQLEVVEIDDFENINWFETTKYDYNKLNKSNYSSDFKLRDVITTERFTSDDEKWLLDTPKAIREASVFEAHEKTKTSLENYFNGHTNKPFMNYKTKKKKSWSFEIPKESILINNNKVHLYKNGGSRCHTPFEFGEFELTEKTNHENEHPNQYCRIIFDGKSYYLAIPEKRKKKYDLHKHFVIASDPGVHKFQTMFIPEKNEYIEIGEQSSKKIYQYLITLDNFISKLTKVNCKKRKILKNKITKLRIKIKNLQTELHNKTSIWLGKNFEVVVIPQLNKNNDMIKRKSRKLKTKTVRQMVLLGHNEFIKKLKTKAEEYNSIVEIVTEEYTSQICSNCKRHTKTSQEIYKCKHCKYKVDRDLQGSKNILIKNLYETFKIPHIFKKCVERRL